MPPLTVKSPNASEFDPGGKKAAARARALAEAAREAPQVEAAQVEATPVEAPVEAAPARRTAAPAAPAAPAQLAPLVLPAHTVVCLRDVVHELLIVADSCLEHPDGAEIFAFADQGRALLVRAAQGQVKPEALADPVEAPAAPAEAAVEAAVEAPVDAEAAAAPTKAAKK